MLAASTNSRVGQKTRNGHGGRDALEGSPGKMPRAIVALHLACNWNVVGKRAIQAGPDAVG